MPLPSNPDQGPGSKSGNGCLYGPLLLCPFLWTDLHPSNPWELGSSCGSLKTLRFLTAGVFHDQKLRLWSLFASFIVWISDLFDDLAVFDLWKLPTVMVVGTLLTNLHKETFGSKRADVWIIVRHYLICGWYIELIFSLWICHKGLPSKWPTLLLREKSCSDRKHQWN